MAESGTAGSGVPASGTAGLATAGETRPAGSAAQVEGVVAAVAGALGIVTERGGDPVDRLAGALAERRMVLVLDNCEHVVAAVAVVAERVLAAAPGITVLATSREPLDVPGEALHPVAPMDLHGDAVALFADRAAAARPGFRLDAGTRDDVTRVCERVDGLPLAIELAAARLRALDLPTLAAVVGERVLDRGSRTGRQRHRTLRAVIDWSWETLSADERELLARLSVFAGAADSDAILRVCDADLDTLVSLVDKSLVQPGYRLLQTVRAYAAEKAPEYGEDGARDRHLAWFLDVARTADPLLRTRDQLTLLTTMDAARGDLDAALAHALRADHASALRLIGARLWSWIIRGRREEAREWASAVVAAVDVAEVAPELRTEYALCLLIAPAAGDRSDALDLAELSDHPAALVSWTLATGYLDEPARIRGRARRLTARFEGHPDPWTRATARLVRAIVEFELTPGGAPAAETLIGEAIAGYEEVGERWGLSVARYWLSLILENKGDLPGALRVLELAARAAAELGGTQALPGPAMLAAQLARLRAANGDLTGAESLLDPAGRAAARLGDEVALARVEHARAVVARRRGRDEEARRLLRGALARTRGYPTHQLRALIEIELSRVLAPEEAGAAIEAALRSVAQTADDVIRATVLEAAAEWRLAMGDPSGALAALTEALALRGIAASADPAVHDLLRRCREASRP